MAWVPQMTLMLEGKVDDRDTIIAGLRAQLQETREERDAARKRNQSADVGLKQLRETLSPLYRALQQVFGDLDDLGVQENSPATSTAIDGRKKAIWDSWKQKLGGLTGRAIDALLLHGAMNQTQLRIHLSCANGSVSNIVTALKKAGLINQVDGKISLKEL